MTELYRLVYQSRTLLPGSEAEIAAAVAQILETSQRNNARAGVTGALMFNQGCFAQVLEGPRHGVEATFERIQRDPRHSDVAVLHCASVAERSFSNWSMAFVGQSARGRALWGGIADASGFDPARLDGEQVFSVLHGLVMEEEAASDAAAPDGPGAPPASASSTDLDPRAQMRHLARSLRLTPADEARRQEAIGAARAGRDAEPEAAGAGSALLDLELAIVKKALRAERHRMADLTARIEEMQAALVAGERRAESLRRDRDRWAERARLLAMPVFQGFAALDEEGSAGTPGAALRSVA